MSVTGPNYNINATALLSKMDLEKGIIGKGSWHEEYKDSCYVFVGGLPYKMTEGDVVIVFSQCGEVIDVHLVRDKKTGASKGYGFVGYENQKSTIIAVDNFNGYEFLGKKLHVDHCRNFRAPKQKDDKPYEPTGPDGRGIKFYETTQEEEPEPLIPKNPKPDPKSFEDPFEYFKDSEAKYIKKREKKVRSEVKKKKKKEDKKLHKNKHKSANQTTSLEREVSS